MLISLLTFITTLVFLKGSDSALSNVTNASDLPEIKHGMKCVYGKKYRMDCNTCHCGHRNSLLCTKIACIESGKTKNDGEISEEEPNDAEKNREGIEKRKRLRRIVRRENKRYLRTDSPAFPPLPPSRKCFAGRLYQEDCKRCFCKANRVPACSAHNACIQPKLPRELVPEDLRPPVKDSEFRDLPVLPHTASPCAPGTTYKVDCNVCLCNEYQNLLCDKLLCVSFADIHRAEAVKKSGLPCNANDNAENSVLQSKCVQCSCNGTTFCEAKGDCVAETEVMMRTYNSRRNGSRLTFDLNKEKCIPNHIYKDDCNKCYCQEDETLRCTQKICLNYNQALEMEKEHKYLEEHGL
nr:uncharacterized protein LOC110381956 isoform X1 [Helicoverpa armigera]